MKLTDLKCRNVKPKDKPYKIYDGQGLYMQVMPSGSRYWRFKYGYGGRRNTLALGVYPEISLAEARDMTHEARKQVRAGNDPALLKRQKKLAIIDKTQNTFEKAAYAWFEHNHAKWSAKHAKLIMHRLRRDLFPVIGKTPLIDITPRPIYRHLHAMQEKGNNEVAKRSLQYASRIFSFAIATEKTERNPAAEIRSLLRPYKRGHYRALEYKDLSTYLAALNENSAGLSQQTRLALRFMLLTFVRTNELVNARWSEIDCEMRQWVIPAEKMKMKREHVVPLSVQALSILEELRNKNTFNSKAASEYDWVFPQTRSPRKPMSNMTMLTGLKQLGFKDKTTIHGFRAVAMTAIKERLNYQHDIVDRQLAHAPADKLGRAYDRAEFLDQRKKMMQDWADHLDALTSNNVIFASFKK